MLITYCLKTLYCFESISKKTTFSDSTNVTISAPAPSPIVLLGLYPNAARGYRGKLYISAGPLSQQTHFEVKEHI